MSGKRLSIAGLYTAAQTAQTTLFPSSSFAFWEDYTANSAAIDRYFENRYHSFLYARSFKEDAADSTILTHWKDTITAHFFINAKRYNELYRVQVLDPTSYDIINNYDLTESSERDNTGTQTQAYGQRIDSTQYGQTQQSTQYGQTQETTQHGQKQLTDVYGQRQDTNQTTLGQQTSTSTDKRSAFNSTTLQDVAGGNIQNGSRQDSATLTTGTHTDTHTDAQRTDTVTGTQHTDTVTGTQHTDTVTKGQQSDTRTDALKEKMTLHRRGNIGVQTVADVVGGFVNLWEKLFNFYQMIFDEIVTQYLCIDDSYEGVYSVGGSSGGGGGDASILQAIAELSQQLNQVQQSINSNVDSSETAINAHTDTAVTGIASNVNGHTDTAVAGIASNVNGHTDTALTASDGVIQQYIVAATTAVGGQITTSTAQIRGDIVEVSTDGY